MIATASQRAILRHALGLDQARESYRNRFVAGPGHTDWPDLMALVAAGLMVNRGSLGEISGGDDVLMVTEAGRHAAKAQEKKP